MNKRISLLVLIVLGMGLTLSSSYAASTDSGAKTVSGSVPNIFELRFSTLKFAPPKDQKCVDPTPAQFASATPGFTALEFGSLKLIPDDPAKKPLGRWSEFVNYVWIGALTNHRIKYELRQAVTDFTGPATFPMGSFVSVPLHLIADNADTGAFDAGGSPGDGSQTLAGPAKKVPVLYTSGPEGRAQTIQVIYGITSDPKLCGSGIDLTSKGWEVCPPDQKVGAYSTSITITLVEI